MTKIIITTCIFFFILYLRNAVSSGTEVEQKRKEGDVKYNHLWFGPRIGRRKRNPNEEILRNFDSNDVQNLVNFIKKNPWTIIVLSTGDFEGYKMTRESTGNSRGDPIELVQRFSPYVPRLGRAVPYYQ